jgi:LEA14-like dessication related protein
MRSILSILTISLIVLSSCGTNNLKEPEYRDIRNIRLLNLGPLQSTAGVDLVYYNPNKFGVQLETARGDIYVDSSYFGQFELNEKVQVKKRSEFILPATIKVDMVSAIKNQRDLLKKKEALVRVQGTAMVRKAGFSKEVPISYEHIESIDHIRALVTTNTNPQQ